MRVTVAPFDVTKASKLSLNDPLVVEILRKRRPLVASELKYYLDTKFLGRRYQDAWKRVESTK